MGTLTLGARRLGIRLGLAAVAALSLALGRASGPEKPSELEEVRQECREMDRALDSLERLPADRARVDGWEDMRAHWSGALESASGLKPAR